VANDERSKKFRSMGLLRILNRIPNRPSEEQLKELNRKLNAIHKKI
jgi:hypothetical protein